MPWLNITLSVVVTTITVLGAGWALRRLPPPGGHDGTELPWARLPQPRWSAGLAFASLLAGLIGACLAPPATVPLWLVWAGPVALLIAIDAATTWLPLSLTRVCWGALVVAAAAAFALGLPPERLPVMLVAAAAGFTLFWLLWRLSGGQLGFGDVRLAPMIAAVAASVSVGTAVIAFIVGSLAGVLLGIVARLRGHSAGFAYGPALWVGPPVAVALGALLN